MTLCHRVTAMQQEVKFADGDNAMARFGPLLFRMRKSSAAMFCYSGILLKAAGISTGKVSFVPKSVAS